MRDKGVFWGVLLYLLTLVCEIPAIVARVVIIGFLVSFPIGFLSRGSPVETGATVTAVFQVALLLAVLPVLLSLATLLFLPSGGGWLMRREMNAHPPSDRERRAIQDALDLVIPEGSNVPRPSRFYVVNSPEQNAGVIGTTLYVWQGLIWTPHLAPVVAHELGHLASVDGRLTVATRRLTYPLFAPLARWLFQHRDKLGCLAWVYAPLLVLMAGGFGLWLLQIAWRAYWRDRELAADAYAAALGQGRPLIEFLEQFLYLDPVIPWIGNYYPRTEERVSRLVGYEQGEALPELQSGPPMGRVWAFTGGGLVLLVALGCAWFNLLGPGRPTGNIVVPTLAAGPPTVAPAAAAAVPTVAPAAAVILPTEQPTATGIPTTQPAAAVGAPSPAPALLAPLERDLTLQDPPLAGSDVQDVQVLLSQLGYLEGSGVTRAYDGATEAAVRRFQERNGLEVDGVVGQATWEALNNPGATRGD